MPKSDLQRQREAARGVLAAGGPAAVRREVLLRLRADRAARLFQQDHRHLLDTGDVAHADRVLAEARRRGIAEDGYPAQWPAGWKANPNKPLPDKDELRAEIQRSRRYA